MATAPTNSESDGINHGTLLNGGSSIEELEPSEQLTEEHTLSPTDMEPEDGNQTLVLLDHSETPSGKEPSSTETRTFKTMVLLF